MADTSAATTAPAAVPTTPTTTPPPAPAAPASASTPSAPMTPTDRFSALDERASKRKDKAAAPAKEAPAPKAAAEISAKTTEPPAAQKAPDPKALRERLAVVEREKEESAGQITALRQQIADFERKGRDTTALTEQLAREQKEKAELQAQIRGLKREASPEFKDKYDKPFNQAAEFARSRIEGLAVTLEDGATRQATWNDFAELYRLPFNKASALAKQMFGDSTPFVLNQLSELQRLDFQRNEALKEEQVKWKETEEREVAEGSKRREFIQATWTKVNTDIAETHPEWFQEDPKDKEESDLLKEGFALVDSRPATMEEQIVKDAHIRNRAAAWPRLIHRLTRLQEQLEEKDAVIAELKGSQPGPGNRPSGSQPAKSPDQKSWKDDLRESMS